MCWSWHSRLASTALAPFSLPTPQFLTTPKRSRTRSYLTLFSSLNPISLLITSNCQLTRSVSVVVCCSGSLTNCLEMASTATTGEDSRQPLTSKDGNAQSSEYIMGGYNSVSVITSNSLYCFGHHTIVSPGVKGAVDFDWAQSYFGKVPDKTE